VKNGGWMPVANDLGSITLLRAKRLWSFLMETGNPASRFLSKILATYALIINGYISGCEIYGFFIRINSPLDWLPMAPELWSGWFASTMRHIPSPA
jgi:hypothetical protein